MADSFDSSPTHIHAGASTEIDITQADDICYWTSRLDVDEAQLRKAVADVGVATDAVAIHLGVA